MSTGDGLTYVTPGTPLRIPASAYNSFVDAARAHRRAFGTGAAQDQATGLDGRQTVVLVKNTTGSDVGLLSVLGIGGVQIDPNGSDAAKFEFLRRPVLTGVAPAEGTHDTAFVILLEPIANNEFGRAVIAGCTPAIVNVTDADHGYAVITDADPSTLTSAPTGPCRILWKPAGTGTGKICLVRIDQADPIGTHETPAEVGDVTEGSETADADTWDVTSPPADTDGLQLAMLSRVVYNDAGDETLYGFARVLTFDSTGRLVAVSAETRFTIDITEACA